MKYRFLLATTALVAMAAPAVAQFRIDRNIDVDAAATGESSGIIQGTVGYLADTATATGGDNLGNHVATAPLNMSGFPITGIATPDGTDPGAGVNVQFVLDQIDTYSPGAPDLTDYVTKSGAAQTITSTKTFDAPVLFSDDVEVSKVPSAGHDVTNKAYIDNAIADLVTLTTSQTVSGDKSFTGSVAVQTPTGNMGAANKLYVDNAISAAGGNYVTMGTDQIIGGTPITGAKGFTGAVTFDGEVNVTATPNDANDAINKAYVDDLTDGLAGRVTVIEGDVTALKADVTTLKGNVTTLQSDVMTLQGDVSTLDARVTNLANATITAGSGIAVSGTLGGGITVAVDPTVVRTAGAQTISGVKSFASLPEVPVAPPTAGNQVASKSYVDAQVAGAVGTTYTAGDGLSLGGTVFAVDGTVVRTSDPQTLGGVKTFTSIPKLPSTLPVADEDAASKAYVDSVGNVIRQLPNGTDIDTITTTGLYSIGNTSGILNLPDTTWGMYDAGILRVTADPFTHIVLQQYTYHGDGDVPGLSYTRSFYVDPVTGDRANVMCDDMLPTCWLADFSMYLPQTISGPKTFSSTVDASISGNAGTATTLKTARTINGISFNGAANITLPTVNTTGAQTVAGVKTFSSLPVIPTTAPTLAGQVASKSYVDTKVAAATGTTYAAGDGMSLAGNVFAVDGTVVRTNGAQTLAGVKTFSSAIDGSITGNAATATKLAAAQTINGVAFDGSAAIALPTVNTSGDQIVSGVKTFSSLPQLPASAPTLANEAASKSYVDAQVAAATGTTYTAGSGLTLSGTTFAADGTVVRTSGDQTLAGVKTFSSTIAGSITGNAGTALKLAAPQTINGVGFDGSAAITLPTVNTSGDQAVAGVKTFSSLPQVPTTTPTLAAEVASKAYVDGLNAANVKLTGDQTVAGIKTLSGTLNASGTVNATGTVNLPAATFINTMGTTSTSVANKAYVDSKVGYAAGSGMILSGNTFSVDGTVVRTTGAQGIAGVKTFTDIPVLPSTAPTNDLQAVNKGYVDTKFGIGEILSTTDDFNTILLSGYHKATTGIPTSAALALNRPSGQPGMLEVLNNNNSIMQRYSTINATGTFYRTRNSSGTWFAWVPFASYNAGDGLDLDVGAQSFSVDTTVLRTTGAQTISGTRTHTGTLTATGAVNLPSTTYINTMGTTTTSVTNKAYVDGLDAANVKKTGNQTIAGTKTFSSAIFAPAFTVSSDARLKENVEPIVGFDLLHKVRPVSYTLKEDGHKAMGVIAQEVEQVYPFIVRERGDGMKTVEYTQLIAPMIAAIQELDARVKVLEAKR